MVPHTLLLDLHAVRHDAWTRAADRSRLRRAASAWNGVVRLWKGPSVASPARPVRGTSADPLPAGVE
jgi:hypothetical protein